PVARNAQGSGQRASRTLGIGDVQYAHVSVMALQNLIDRRARFLELVVFDDDSQIGGADDHGALEIESVVDCRLLGFFHLRIALLAGKLPVDDVGSNLSCAPPTAASIRNGRRRWQRLVPRRFDRASGT